MIKKNLLCLGIESTAHTFGIGIMNGKKIIANASSSYATEKSGIIPMEAAAHHAKVKEKVLKKALDEANLSLKDINLIAYSKGPGLAPCLLQGLHLAKELAEKLKISLVPVNHCIAHLEISRLLYKIKDPVFLYVSGANTQVISYAAKRYRIFGETLDMGVGNFIDSFARHCRIGFPGGPRIEELAKKSNTLIELPYSVKGMDVAFSGLLTNLKQKYDSGFKIEDLAFSLQEYAFAMLTEVSERAMAFLGKKELVLVGGVGSNKRFCEMLSIMCKERKAKFYSVPEEYAKDNGVMIAWLGFLLYKAKQAIDVEKADIKPYERTDEVKVTWL